jgi:hypothetical protein
LTAVTRRALLGAGLAGGAGLLSGCGPDGSSRLPPPQPTLDAQLAAQEAVVRAYRGLAEREPAYARDLRRMAAAARAGAARLRAAGARERRPRAEIVPPSLLLAQVAEEAALAAHVAGLRTGPRGLRSLTTQLVLTAAQHEAVLSLMLVGNPGPSALPGAK